MPAHKLFEVKREYAPPIPVGTRSLTCESCALSKQHINTPRMWPFGGFDKRLMVIGEAPGADEDRHGRPWQGRTGTKLRDTLREFGVDLFKDAVSLNSANCRPPENRAPTPNELACCWFVRVHPAITKYKPAVIMLMGGSAVASVMGSVQSRVDPTISKWRGFAVPMPEWNCWICPTFHPSYIMREGGRPEIEAVWKLDIELALSHLDKPVPQHGDLPGSIIIPKNEDAVVRALERVIKRKGLFSFDYETTGLRAVSHEIVCASFATDPDRATAFMFNGSERINDAWKRVMEDPDIKKISHNLKFEYEWTRHHFKVDRIAWAWDSMMAAHILDNRPGICSLKHQAFLKFGVQPYDEMIGPYLESTNSRDPHSSNRIREFITRYGEEEALRYCGIDSLLTYRLAMQQMEEIGAAS
jgi:uracil-DNA glycosylase family 4